MAWLNLKKPIYLLRVPEPTLNGYSRYSNGNILTPDEFVKIPPGIYEMNEENVKIGVSSGFGFSFETIRWIVLDVPAIHSFFNVHLKRIMVVPAVQNASLRSKVGCAKVSFPQQLRDAGEVTDKNPNLRSKFEVIFS